MPGNGQPKSIMKDSRGWDGKLRVDRRAHLTNPDIPDTEYSDDEAPRPEVIEADEGRCLVLNYGCKLMPLMTDLLDDFEINTDVSLRLSLFNVGKV